MKKLFLLPFKLLYYCLYPFIWFYKRYFGYSGSSSDGIDFEYNCANILRGRGFSNVEVTKASGDQGVDVLASKGGRRYAIQCKLYSNPVGNKAVQEAYAGKAFYGCTDAAVMTNTSFTESAKELATSLGVELWGNTPTSSKRANSPIVFWASLIAMLAYWLYLNEFSELSEEIIDDKAGNAFLIWIVFILAYVFVFPAIKGLFKRILVGIYKIRVSMLEKKLDKLYEMRDAEIKAEFKEYDE